MNLDNLDKIIHLKERRAHLMALKAAVATEVPHVDFEIHRHGATFAPLDDLEYSIIQRPLIEAINEKLRKNEDILRGFGVVDGIPQAVKT